MSFDFQHQPSDVQVKKAMIVDFRPAAIPPQWSSTDSLANDFITKMNEASHNTLVYKVVNKQAAARYPLLTDGRQYTDATWTQARQDDKSALRDVHGNYLLADYQQILHDFNVLQMVRTSAVDEVWLFGGPYFGFYESRMIGKGAFWCNAPGVEQDTKRFVVMGFNYERTVREMIHSFGHRAESILVRQYGSQQFFQALYAQQPTPPPKNEFEQWLLTNGTVHRKPGGGDYSQDEFVWASALKLEWWPLILDPNKVA